MKIRHVYFIQNPATKAVKIGASIDPIKRKRELERDVGNQLSFLYIYLGGGKLKEKEKNIAHKKYILYAKVYFENANIDFTKQR